MSAKQGAMRFAVRAMLLMVALFFMAACGASEGAVGTTTQALIDDAGSDSGGYLGCQPPGGLWCTTAGSYEFEGWCQFTCSYQPDYLWVSPGQPWMDVWNCGSFVPNPCSAP
jgi:hypothetical protein